MEHLDLGGDEDKQGHGSCRQVQGGLHLVGRQGAPATPGGGADARLSRVSSEQGAGNGRCGFSNRSQIGVLACLVFHSLEWIPMQHDATNNGYEDDDDDVDAKAWHDGSPQ